MLFGDAGQALDRAFEQIESTILPQIAIILDTLVAAAETGAPDERAQRAELATIALMLDTLARDIEATARPAGQPVAEPARMEA